jgi:hypothetical protein
MSSHPEVICACISTDIDSNLIDAAKSECDGLDLNTTASFMVFQPGKICVKIIDSVKKQVCFGFTGETSVNAAKAYAMTEFAESTWAECLCDSSRYYHAVPALTLHCHPD